MHEMRRFYAGKIENCDQPVFYRFFAGLIRNVDRPVTAGPVRSKKTGPVPTLIYMQLHFEMNFHLKVIMEE
jgi:hypothetical protein